MEFKKTITCVALVARAREIAATLPRPPILTHNYIERTAVARACIEAGYAVAPAGWFNDATQNYALLVRRYISVTKV